MTARRYSTTTRRCASAVSLCGDRQAAPTYSPVLRVAVSRVGRPSHWQHYGRRPSPRSREQASQLHREPAPIGSRRRSLRSPGTQRDEKVTRARRQHGRSPVQRAPTGPDPSGKRTEWSPRNGTPASPLPPPTPVPCPASSRRRHGALPARWAGAAPASPPGDPVPGGSRPPCGDLGPPLLIPSPPVLLQALDPAQSVGLAGTGDLAQPAWDCRA